MAFDQDEFIHLLTDFYEFCSRAFWDLGVQYAPEGGWPSINQQTLAGLEKNNEVIELLRHLPYPDFNVEPQQAAYMPLIMFDTPVIDYRSEYIQDLIGKDIPNEFPEPYNYEDRRLPPSCVGIALTFSRNGYFVVVDTEDGYVYWGDPNGQHDEPGQQLNITLEKFEDDPENDWRSPCVGVNVYRPVDFFKICKQRFRELRWIGAGHWHIDSLRMYCKFEDMDEEHARQVKCMRAAGWPGDGEGRGWDQEKYGALLRASYDQEERTRDEEEQTHHGEEEASLANLMRGAGLGPDQV